MSGHISYGPLSVSYCRKHPPGLNTIRRAHGSFLREGTIALRSAVSGIGTESNAELLDHPYLLLDDPYTSGWVLRIAETAKSGTELLNSNDFTPLLS